jgi:FkbM family methyltransferase
MNRIITILKKAAEIILPKSFHLPLRYFWLQITGKLDSEMIQVSKQLTKTRRFLDIGANVGTYSYHFSKVFDHIEAFEPISEVTYRLNALKLKNVTVHQVALSDSENIIDFYIPFVNGVPEPSIASIEKRDAACEIRKVQIHKLDQYEFEDIDLIKIDVEGHESAVIRGAMETLKRCSPIIIIEIEQRHINFPIYDVFDLIIKQDYSGYFTFSGALKDLSEFNYEEHQKPYLNNVMNKNYINNFIFFPKETV